MRDHLNVQVVDVCLIMKIIGLADMFKKHKKNTNKEYVLADARTAYIVPICDKCNKTDAKAFSIESKYLFSMSAEECKLDYVMNNKSDYD